VTAKLRHHHVRLADGTVWAVDHEANGEHSIEWHLRYGGDYDLVRVRLVAASIISSYMALLGQSQKRRNEIVREINAALDAATAPEGKD